MLSTKLSEFLSQHKDHTLTVVCRDGETRIGKLRAHDWRPEIGIKHMGAYSLLGVQISLIDSVYCCGNVCE